MVDNAPSVSVLRCSKNLVDARDKNIQQRAESLSLAGAIAGHTLRQHLLSELPTYKVEEIPCLIGEVPSFGLLARENERNVIGRRWAERGIHLCIRRSRGRRRYSHLLTDGDNTRGGGVVNA